MWIKVNLEVFQILDNRYFFALFGLKIVEDAGANWNKLMNFFLSNWRGLIEYIPYFLQLRGKCKKIFSQFSNNDEKMLE